MVNFTALAAVVNTLAPVFLIVLLGAILRRNGFLGEEFSSALNKLIFWVALPCLLFTTIAGSQFHPDSLDATAVLMLATLAIAAVAWFGAPLFGIDPRGRGSFTQSVFRSNNAYVGLPVIVAAYAGQPQLTAVQSLAMLTLAPCLILYNVLAVFVLTPVDPAAGARAIPWRKVARGIATNPLIVACVLGGLAMGADVHLPPSLSRTLESLGRMAGPGALIALGSSLTRERMRASFRAAHIATALKLLACPAIGWALGVAFGLDRDARFITLAYLASPTAVASFVMAQAMKGDAVLAGGTVAVSTVYSVGALALVLLLAGPVPATAARDHATAEAAPQAAAARSLRIAVSIPPQQGIVRRIAGDRAVVEALVGANQDPHTYEPTPKQLVRLASSDVLFTIGLPFERALLPRLAASHKALSVVDTAAGYPPLALEHEHGEPGHEHGEACTAGLADPHLWLAPSGIVHQAAAIAAQLARIDPEHAATYEAHARGLAADVAAFDRRARDALAPHRGRTFFVYHPAWGHFAAAYGLRQTAIEKHGGAPGAKHAATLLEAARASGARGVLVESDTEAARVRALFGNDAIRTLKVQPLESDPLQALEHTLAAIFEALPATTPGPSETTPSP